MTTQISVTQHYGQPGLLQRILQALQAAGKDIQRLTPDDLASFDELHTLGRLSTINLVRLLGIRQTERVLDIGCGIGGPSRYLASTIGCRVSGIDLTPEFCDVATMLAERTQLANRLDYRQADALALPFADGVFDVVWSQNIVMNIADRASLYREIQRVLKPGGRYGFAEVVAGTGSPYFPLPWAREPSISFLVPAEASRRQIEAAGFDLAIFEDKTSSVLAPNNPTAAVSSPSLGMNLVMGEDGVERTANARRSYADGRIRFVQGVAIRS